MSIQSPVKYSVSTTVPSKCTAIFEAPYTIINLSTETTCWIADNAGLQIGQGTPLYPGTSLAWAKNGDFFAIGEGPLDIIVSKDVLDWEPNPIAIATAILNSGVLIIDKPVSLFSGAINAGNGFTTGLIDITRFQSLHIALIVTALSGGLLDEIEIDFFQDNNPSGFIISTRIIQPLQVHAINAGGGIWQATIPIDGAFFRIRSTSGVTANVAVLGSHRQQETISQTIFNPYLTNGANAQAQTDFYLADFDLLTASNLIVTIPPWFGRISVEAIFTSTAALGTSTLQIAFPDPDSTGVLTSRRHGFPATPTTNVFAIQTEYAVSGDASRIALSNTSGVTWTLGVLRITPVSGYGAVT